MSDEGYCDVDFDGACDDADPVEFYDAKPVKGRKAYPCTECGAEIAAGVQHLRKSYRFDGAFHTDRICGLCQEVAGEFQHTFVGGLLWESFRGEWDNGARLQACLNRLESAAAKSHMRAQWEKWQELERQRALKLREMRDAVRRPTDSPS